MILKYTKGVSLKLAVAALFMVSASGLHAQEIMQQPKAKFITRFPFTMFSGGVIVVKGVYENVADSLSFILDTGGGGISLDSATCALHNIATKETDTIVTGVGGQRKVKFVFGKTLKLPGIDIPRLNFHVVDYDILTSTYGEKIDGIMGFQIFNRFVVKIDYDSNFIELYTKGTFKYPKGTTLHPVFTSLPIQLMQVKDKRKLAHHLYLDTGAGLCLLLSEKFVKDSNLILNKRKPVETQAEGMAGRLKMRLTVVRELKIGPYRFNRVPTYLFADDFNVTGYPFSAGLVGNDLLRRFNVIINYGQREVHLSPNSHYGEPFDYSYTGLGIYSVDSKIVVLDVVAGSPAEQAGLKIFDEIISVGNNPTGNIQAYKTALQNANENIKIIINRKGTMMQLTIKPISIL